MPLSELQRQQSNTICKQMSRINDANDRFAYLLRMYVDERARAQHWLKWKKAIRCIRRWRRQYVQHIRAQCEATMKTIERESEHFFAFTVRERLHFDFSFRFHAKWWYFVLRAKKNPFASNSFDWMPRNSSKRPHIIHLKIATKRKDEICPHETTAMYQSSNGKRKLSVNHSKVHMIIPSFRCRR